ncbi:hypothetical protein [Bifidobacterium olomucense]|uniref:Lipoprotein n=1 Tax=Bifidobacterium olomucense TaxID=2675324 RepID=A0A7Y0EXB6_9BIFI|nr:hypothetical protein [Bifidobacterium sp. DSM 109959]NMM98136.1 hypothetical protein [Bifidobacterium sp. DSM 109959]
MRRFFASLTLLFAAGVLVLSACGVDMAQSIPPCEYEDGSGQTGYCYWDASAHGNHKGAGVFIYHDGDLIAQR